MPPHLVTEDLAAYWTGRPAATIRRWAAEGRLTRHGDTKRRRNGVLYDLAELPAANRDNDTRELITPAEAPPVIDHGLLAA
ncbi:DNA-binding protein [Streptomyces sp. NPDC008150]|uniref:DNA-binding protein n=1 Tax=Streptomyces sp. NPDC008150 TaxID=3364816 RepID=UPI0036EB0B92